MRISCNGCRILRKGCSEKCSIKPCLEWINSAQHQANATLFLAKFYGRAGLLNLINAAPSHLRPAAFKSLLYEACGRIVNPVYGSLGLLSAGDWVRCQAAVDAVLRGSEIKGVANSDRPQDAPHGTNAALSLCDIRHVSRNSDVDNSAVNNKVRGRARFKRAGKVVRPRPRLVPVYPDGLWNPGSSLTSSESSSAFSVETVEASLLNRSDPNRVYVLKDENGANKAEVDLELSLAPAGFRVCKRCITNSGNACFVAGTGQKNT